MKLIDLQRALAAVGYYKGKADGIDGPQTRAAIQTFLEVNRIPMPGKWSLARKQLAAMQLVAKQVGFPVGNIDGLIGPQTRYAFELYEASLKGSGALSEASTWRDDPQPPVIDAPKRSAWPRQADVTRFFGEPGKNQAIIDLPYHMRLAWDTKQIIKRISCHEKVADSVVRVLTRVADAYDADKRKAIGLDLFGGCLNVRKMRGGNAWSMHSWGIALDFDPERNQLKWGRDKARLAKADCDTFWKLWEEEGWLSLGRARNYDWMHVQAALI